MSRAFVLEPTTIDVARARTYGQVIYLFPDGVRRASFWDDEFKRQLVEKLNERTFSPDEDYLVVAGQMAPIAVAISTLVARYGAVKLLLWHSAEHEYWPRLVGEKDTTYGERLQTS